MSNKIEELENEIKELKAQRELIDQQIETKVKMIEKSVQFYVNTFGEVGELPDLYKCEKVYFDMVKQGNVFNSKEEAEKEIKKRALKFEIEEFRKERNDGWEPSFGGSSLKDAEPKWCIGFLDGDLFDRMDVTNCSFPMFGYFKNRDDARMAIMLFGKEIKRLFCGEL